MPYGFTSVAHRKAMFANEPALAANIAAKYGAKIGGGYTKAQLEARRGATTATRVPPIDKRTLGRATGDA